MGRADATVSELVDQLDAGLEEQVWLELAKHARAAIRAAADRDAVMSEVLIRAMDDDAAALRRADPGTPACAWLARTARNVRAERARSALPRTRAPEMAPVDAVRPASSGPRLSGGFDDVDFSLLTDGQRAAWKLRTCGMSERDIAAELRISRAAVRERIRRGLARLTNASSESNHKRNWAREILFSGRFPPSSLSRTVVRALLRDYAAGLTIRTLSRIYDAAPGTLRKRLQRWRKWARRALR